jgi:hypothetical protein
MTINVEENIKKARRSAYGLFSGGYHGNNGLDPDTLIHLFKTYITPVLLYGMELIIPKATGSDLLSDSPIVRQSDSPIVRQSDSPTVR